MSALLLLLQYVIINSINDGRDIFSLFFHIGMHKIEPALEFIMKGVIGVGKLQNNLSSELRIFQFLYGAGLFNLILWLLIGYQLYRKNKWLRSINRKYTACLAFLLVILFSNWHYSTIFVYPNIFIMVIIIAFLSSRTIFTAPVRVL